MSKLVSLFVFMSVSSIVLLAAFYSLRLGVEKESNAKLVAAAVDRVTPKNSLASTEIQIQHQPVLAVHAENPCPINDTAKVKDTVSVVNFLYAMGEDTSYTSRVKLAEVFGIDNYSGKNDQNLEMLSILRKNSGCFTSEK